RDLAKGLARDSARTFYLLMALVVSVALAGVLGFVALERLSAANAATLLQVRRDQRGKIAELEAQTASDAAVRAKLVGEIGKLSAQVRRRGGYAGVFTVTAIPSASPSPGR